MTAQAFAAPTSIAQMSALDFFKSGVEKTQSGDLKQAIVDFTQAIGLDSQMVVAYNNRCLAAIADYNQMIQLKPDESLL